MIAVLCWLVGGLVAGIVTARAVYRDDPTGGAEMPIVAAVFCTAMGLAALVVVVLAAAFYRLMPLIIPEYGRDKALARTQARELRLAKARREIDMQHRALGLPPMKWEDA